jgi:molybdopterin converting factor small subunit
MRHGVRKPLEPGPRSGDVRVRVKLVRPFRDAVGKPEVELDAGSGKLPEAIARLVERFPGLREHLYEAGELSPYVNIYRNGQAVHLDEAHKVTLAEGDELMFLLPMTGG